MSTSLYRDLHWLLAAPDDFKARCAALLEQHAETPGRDLRTLATHALNINQLTRLSKTIDALHEQETTLTPLAPFTLGLVSNATTALMAPSITATAPRHGIDLTLVEADYGQAAQEAMNPQSALNTARPDAVLVAIDYRGLPLSAALGNPSEADAAIEKSVQYLAMIRSGVLQGSGAPCMVQTLPRPPETILGSLDYRMAGALRDLCDRFNRALAESVQGSDDMLLDVAGLADTVGLADWHDPGQWNLAKLPFAQSMVPLYADYVCRIPAAMRGKTRRCLILDLDNTLWGGVIGDDGLDGIALGQGSAQGEAFSAIQHTALSLRERGIVLAVSSKNEESNARLPFQKHPDMVLKEEHIAVFQANWSAKASNIKAISEALDLGLESMVFLDDNPAERAQVRRELPEVAIPELPDDPALYPRTLMAAGYFENTTFSQEDRQRSAYYEANAKRVQALEQVGDFNAYLQSLEMKISFAPFDETGRPRITQLINKSNQFNLTTRRYTETQVAEFQKNPHYYTLQVRLADTFGDNGMISVVIVEKKDACWEIDTWLMSCRVLKRRVEERVLQEIAIAAKAEGVETLVGRYVPTERNVIVVDHYKELGFTHTTDEADGTSLWEIAVDAIPTEELPFETEHSAAA